jgi:putative transposase
MADYRRLYVPGETYFFTAVTAGRRPWLATAQGLRAFRTAYRRVARDRPFETVAVVVLPDHVHCIWRLPAGDAAFADRWKRLKGRTSELLRARGYPGPFWQKRYWEHLIRDEADLHRHIDYVHYNPVRHGLVERASAWSASSFHRYVRAGRYSRDWGVSVEPAIDEALLAYGDDP